MCPGRPNGSQRICECGYTRAIGGGGNQRGIKGSAGESLTLAQLVRLEALRLERLGQQRHVERHAGGLGVVDHRVVAEVEREAPGEEGSARWRTDLLHVCEARRSRQQAPQQQQSTRQLAEEAGGNHSSW